MWQAAGARDTISKVRTEILRQVRLSETLHRFSLFGSPSGSSSHADSTTVGAFAFSHEPEELIPRHSHRKHVLRPSRNHVRRRRTSLRPPISADPALTPHPQLTTAQYIRKSLIAAYIGNIVGALFVGLPAVYYYLGDYHPTDAKLKELEDGQADANPPTPPESKDGTAQEVYRVASKRS